MSHPRAAVHPQHRAHGGGGGGRGGGRAHAALGASLAGRGRPLARVKLRRSAEELGVPQLRERHVQRRGLSKSGKRRKQEAGGKKKKKKYKSSERLLGSLTHKSSRVWVFFFLLLL